MHARGGPAYGRPCAAMQRSRPVLDRLVHILERSEKFVQIYGSSNGMQAMGAARLILLIHLHAGCGCAMLEEQ